MKLLLLLALLLGAVSTRHLKVDTSSLQSLRGEESLAQDGETAEGATREATAGALMPLPEEEEMEGASGSEDDPEEEEEEEEEVEFSSELDVSPEDIQCPKEEDTVKFFSRPGYKTRGYVMVGSARTFNEAQWVCQRCYRGNLASIHSFAFNYQVQCTSAGLNVAQVWIGGQLRGKGRCRRFVWVDRTVWNFAYWARGQPWGGRQRGRCVTLCARGGHWRRSHCGKRRPFVCTY
ncbi:eosinophil granule major basic protein 1 preproprotein [Cavia porcellus]|uniref:Eosinophil granule major basic protein 1 n=1 Tax=Cavia porcellus TaxID=10141 RepID=EMBP1_CAVPO|nr:eosinophil granule major basic protein 1 preproprotein [Cavia porcellus]P22032.1 RecName: Full=Eosinophil granule major basic protein 1; Short=MBP-1; Flags: Precursor [Cavia porcellus]BAA14291.1 prepro major basic protein 1 [Cavia porcellus]